MKSQASEPITVDAFNKYVLPQLEKIIDKKLENKFEQHEEKMNLKFKEQAIKAIGFKDEILSEVKAMREELAATLGQHERIDGRVTRLEEYSHLPSMDA